METDVRYVQVGLLKHLLALCELCQRRRHGDDVHSRCGDVTNGRLTPIIPTSYCKFDICVNVNMIEGQIV